MQLTSRVHDLVGNQVTCLIIKLFFGYHVRPFPLAIPLSKDMTSNIICLVTDILPYRSILSSTNNYCNKVSNSNSS